MASHTLNIPADMQKLIDENKSKEVKAYTKEEYLLYMLGQGVGRRATLLKHQPPSGEARGRKAKGKTEKPAKAGKAAKAAAKPAAKVAKAEMKKVGKKASAKAAPAKAAAKAAPAKTAAKAPKKAAKPAKASTSVNDAGEVELELD